MEFSKTGSHDHELHEKLIRLEEEIRELRFKNEQNKDLRLLFNISLELLESLEKKTLIQKIVDHAANLASTDTSAIYLVRDGQLFLEATCPQLPAEFPDEFRLAFLKNHPHIKKVIEKRIVDTINDVSKVKLTREENLIIKTRNLRSLVYIPLFVRNRVEGVIILGTIDRTHDHKKHEIDLFTSFSNITSLALENAYLFRDLINTKEKAEESNRLKTAFLHNISHEIRTPLNAIIGFSGLITNDGLPSSTRKEYAEIIAQSNNQLLSIIDDIISIAQIESGQLVASESSVDIISLMRHLGTIYSEKARKKNLSLIVTKPSKSLTMLTDEIKLISILTNLLDNAVKFTQTGTISLEFRKLKSNVEFSVADTGIGIDGSEKEKIFERFYQVDNGSGRIYGGMGLGLAICVAYANAIGGKVSLDSTPGKGSVFTLSVPFKSVSRNVRKTKPRRLQE